MGTRSLDTRWPYPLICEYKLGPYIDQGRSKTVAKVVHGRKVFCVDIKKRREVFYVDIKNLSATYYFRNRVRWPDPGPRGRQGTSCLILGTSCLILVAILAQSKAWTRTSEFETRCLEKIVRSICVSLARFLAAPAYWQLKNSIVNRWEVSPTRVTEK